MNEKEIIERINRIEGLGGMTVNERLYVSGLMDEFDQAMVNDKEKVKQILRWLSVDEASIEMIVNNPVK